MKLPIEIFPFYFSQVKNQINSYQDHTSLVTYMPDV